jgi:transcriptional regulator with XRE-family HTH domain
MSEDLARTIGERVRFYRNAKRKKQTVVSGLVGITPDYLYQIERGKKMPTIPILTQLADVLGIPVSAFLDRQASKPTASRLESAGVSLYRALASPVTLAKEPTSLNDLHDRVRDAWHAWQNSPQRYSELVTRLPALIAETEHNIRLHRAAGEENQRRQAQRCAADLYALLRTVAKRIGRVDLSLLAADRAVRAAEETDDPLRLAASQWNLAHVLLSDHQPEGAETIAIRAAENIRPQIGKNVDVAALYGALILLSAISAVRNGDAWGARQRVREVSSLADKIGERNTLWTAFGPTNVAMYAVSVEVEAGESAEALRLAEQIDHDKSPSIERRVAFLLEQARGHERRRDYSSTLILLNTAEREAPEDVAHRPEARNLLHAVVQRSRGAVASEAARLAKRAGIALD